MILINDEKKPKIKQMVVPPDYRCILLSAMKTPLMLLIYAWCWYAHTRGSRMFLHFRGEFCSWFVLELGKTRVENARFAFKR